MWHYPATYGDSYRGATSAVTNQAYSTISFKDGTSCDMNYGGYGGRGGEESNAGSAGGIPKVMV
jgi:hypothetical protein